MVVGSQTWMRLLYISINKNSTKRKRKKTACKNRRCKCKCSQQIILHCQMNSKYSKKLLKHCRILSERKAQQKPIFDINFGTFIEHEPSIHLKCQYAFRASERIHQCSSNTLKQLVKLLGNSRQPHTKTEREKEYFPTIA